MSFRHGPPGTVRVVSSSQHPERGQASIELVALLPLLTVLAGLGWQAVVAGQAVWLSGSAARAAARAEALGDDPEKAAAAALPEALRGGVSVDASDSGEVRLLVTVPSVIGARRLATIAARARFAPQT